MHNKILYTFFLLFLNLGATTPVFSENSKKIKRKTKETRTIAPKYQIKFIGGPTIYPLSSLGGAVGYYLPNRDLIESEITSSYFLQNEEEDSVYEFEGQVITFGVRYKLSILKSYPLPRGYWYSSYFTQYYLNLGAGAKLVNGDGSYQSRLDSVADESFEFEGQSFYLDLGVGYMFYFSGISLGLDFLGIFLPIYANSSHNIIEDSNFNKKNEIIDSIDYFSRSTSFYALRAFLGYSF